MKLWKKIDILFCVTILVIQLFRIDVKTLFETFTNSNSLLVMIFLIFLLIFILLVLSIPYLAVYFGIRYAIKRQEKKRMTINVVEDIDYYREIFKEISPATLSLLASLSIENKKDITAMLLYYEQHNIIRYNENKEIIIVDNNSSLLRKSDKFLLNYISNHNSNSLNEWKKSVINEAISDGYLRYKFKNKIGCLPILIFHILTLACILFLSFYLNTPSVTEQYNNMMQNMSEMINLFSFIDSINFILSNPDYVKVTALFLMAGLFVLIYLWEFIFGILFVFSSIIHINNLKRTKEGEILTEKIWGMKNFIHEFSNLEDATKKQIILWEDFLIYAVVLEENTKILEEMQQYSHKKIILNNIIY